MTNPDNVGGLLPCPFCGGEAELVGGEQDEFCHWHVQCTVCGAISGESLSTSTPDRDFASESWNLRELCRAAPAGGDVAKGDWNDWFKTWAKARGMTMQLTEDGRFLCPDTSLAQKAHEAGCMTSHIYYMELCRQEELAKDSAPAGAGEVGPILIHAQQLHLDGHMDQCALDELTALLRKLQQGAE